MDEYLEYLLEAGDEVVTEVLSSGYFEKYFVHEHNVLNFLQKDSYI